MERVRQIATVDREQGVQQPVQPLDEVPSEQQRVVAGHEHLQALDRPRWQAEVDHGHRERLGVRREAGAPGLDQVGPRQCPAVEQRRGPDLELGLGVPLVQGVQIAVDGGGDELADVDLDPVDPHTVGPLVVVDVGVDPLPAGVVDDRAPLGLGRRTGPVDVDLEVGAGVGQAARHRAGQEHRPHAVVGCITRRHRLRDRNAARDLVDLTHHRSRAGVSAGVVARAAT